MMSTYDIYLFYIDGNDKNFGVISLQTENIFILANDIFAIAKKIELKKAKLLIKNREKLIFNTYIKFNGGYFRLTDNNSLFFSQEK